MITCTHMLPKMVLSINKSTALILYFVVTLPGDCSRIEAAADISLCQLIVAYSYSVLAIIISRHVQF